MANAPRRPCIVVGIDPSDESDVALREGIRALKREPLAELHLVHAAQAYAMPPPTPGPMGQTAGSDVSSATQLEALKNLPAQYLTKAQRIARQEGIVPETDEIEVHIRMGSPARVILDIAQEVGADVIIVGCHGRTGVRRALLGSVAESVVRHAECPVLVARAGSYTAERTQPEPPRPDAEQLHNLESKAPSERFSYRKRQRVDWTRNNPDTAGLL